MGVIVKNNVAKYSARVEAGVAAAVASTVNDIEVITALTSTNLQTAPGSGVI